jgi:hypothetical protein
MEFSFNPDVLLEMPNIDVFINFFKDVLGLKVTKFEESELYEIKTDKVNFYLKKNSQYNVVFDFLVSDREKAKEICLNNNCIIHNWDDSGYHIKHQSGFTFNIGEIKSKL